MRSAAKSIFTFSTALAAISFAAAPAHAQLVGDDVVTALNTQLGYQGSSIEGGSVATSGDTVTISGATFNSGSEEAFTISELVLTGVQATGDGGYTIDTATVPSFTVNDSGTEFTVGDIQVTNYVIAPVSETDPIARSGLFDTMLVGPIAVSENGVLGFSMAGVELKVGPYAPGQVWTSSVVASDFELNPVVFDDAQTQAALSSLGYDTLTGDITMNATWAAESGALGIEDFLIDVDNAAGLEIDLGLGGYTMELVDAMQKINATAENDQAAGMAMLGLMQQLEITGAAITVSDASLTNKLLEFFGAQQGTDAEGMKAFAKGMLPLGLA
ncbi:MAG: hypothetical protein AAFR13_08315, partial [Pseudomonadota bacterium]